MTVLLAAPLARAATVTWVTAGPSTNDWYGTNNWSTTNVPAAGDDVRITNANVGVLLTNSVGYFSSILLSNKCTLIFSNWNTSLSATNVTILTNGVMTLPAAFTNNQMSNRVWIACSNLTLAAGASINADGKGYRGGTNAAYFGQGPGGGGAGAGGGHGGPGGDYSTSSEGGQPYDSYDAPIYPGSGGGGAGDSRAGGNGGGAVQIVASGQVTVNGTITANGNMFAFGAGSGGAILIACNTFVGTNGVLRADGGDVQGADGGGGSILGPGGGGRIAVTYNGSAQQPLPKPTVQFSVGGRNGRTGTNSSPLIRDDGDMGTIYFTDTSLLNETWLPHTGQLWFASGNAWAPNQLIVSNGWIRFPAPGFQLIVSNDLQVIGPRGNLEMGGDQYTTNFNVGAYAFVYSGSTGPTLRVGGSLMLSNGGCLTVYAGLTNASTNYGALVAVTNTIWIDTNSWLYPHSNPTNGGSVLLTMASLAIPATTNGGIGADGRGYRRGLPARYWGWGPGSADYYSGGGYGGAGGRWSPWLSGPTYGSSNAPMDPGSSGGGDSTLNSIGGNGGGLIRIQASATVLNRGVISANGENPKGNGGGGSGGGIYVVCKTFGGDSNGVLRADGGTGQVGGGGGRIAVWRVYDTTGEQLSSHVNGSIGLHVTSTAFPGTIVWGQLPVPGTIFTIH